MICGLGPTARLQIALASAKRLVNVRLGTTDGSRRLPIAAGGQRSGNLLEAGIRARFPIVHETAQVVDRAVIQRTCGDRPIELRHGAVVFVHDTHSILDPTQRKEALRGHGGGATVTPVNWERLVAALRNNRMPDWDVYDSVTSSAISPLSEKSVAGGNTPVEFPDFTKGKWKTSKPYDIE